MKNFCKILYLPALAFLIVGQLIQCMEPIKESRKYTFKWQKTEAMRRVLHTMITDLPAIPKKPQDKKIYLDKFKIQLEAISALIQTPLFDPGTIIAELIKRRELGNNLYDIAREKNHRAMINWLTQQNLVNFTIVIGNDSTYEMNVVGIGRITSETMSEPISIYEIEFPLTLQGYGEVWSKLIKEKILERNELIREIVNLNLPSNAIIKTSINLTGKKPPYAIDLSYSPLKKEELTTKNRIDTNDSLDLFALLKHHQLTDSSRATRWSSYLTANDILNWPDATKSQDLLLDETALTKIPSGRYTRRDIYRYILNLPKDNYTVQDIQKSFDQLVQEMGSKHVLGWSEYIASQGLVAGPFSWLAMLSRVPINKDTVISAALRLLKKAYQNLMMDKGVSVGE